MNAEFVAGAAGRHRGGAIGLAALSLGMAAIAGAGGLHAAPVGPFAQLEQAQQGDAGLEQDTGMSGSQAGPQSGGPAIDQHDEGRSHRPAASTGPGAGGVADGPGKQGGSDARSAPSGGAPEAGNSAKGAAASSDKGPGHRSGDTKPGH